MPSQIHPLIALARPAAALAIAAGLAACAGPALAQEGETEMPLTRLTLYRSGVGYFERRAVVRGDAEVELRFDRERVNDILKSMVLLDLGGGTVEAVGYDSKEPLERRLAGFDIDVSGSPSLWNIISQLRGERIEIETSGSRVTGRVLGMESRKEERGGVVVSVGYVNLATPTLRSIDLSTARSVKILDPELEAELGRALEALAAQRDENETAMSLRFSGNGRREIVAAYVHEAPVWKATYRLILPEDDGDPVGLQGWAIVENHTDEDWDDVTLSLVSGQPVSFRMNLYEPLFLSRPEVPVPAVAVATSQVFERGRAGRGQSPWAATTPRAELALEDADSFHRRFPMESEEGVQRLMSTLADVSRAVATAGATGDVFSYTIDSPISIERRRSAMLPIVGARVAGRRLSVYDSVASPGGRHPMRGVEITNDAGLELMPGPMSVLDGSSYAGDAQIGFVARGEDRLLTFAVDLELTVDREDTSTSRIDSLTAVDGVLRQRTSYERRSTYSIDNADPSDDRVVLIQHPISPAWELAAVEGGAETERTDRAHRIEAVVDAAAEHEVTLVERRQIAESIAVVGYDLERLAVLVREGRVSDRLAREIREAQRLSANVQETELAINALDAGRGRIGQSQARLRENMRVVGRETDLYARYLRELTEQEDRLDEIERERTRRSRELDDRRGELREHIRSIG